MSASTRRRGNLGGMTDRSVVTRAMPWVARAAWIAVAVFGGEAVDAAVDGRSAAVRWAAAIGAWGVWALVALALAIPSVRSLTVVRVLAPSSIVAAAASAIGGAPAAAVALLAVPALVTTLATFGAEFGRTCVQASAYGDEQRFPLRVPVAAGTAAVVVWLLWAPALVAGPLLLAARSWVAGALCAALALAGAVFLGPRWHRLSRRWLVLVPAGVVVVDPVVLADTLMLRTGQIAAMRLAPADTQAADLTGPASGYAVEVTTSETVNAVFASTPREPGGRAIHMTAFLVSPSRPGAALRAAADRGLPVA